MVKVRLVFILFIVLFLNISIFSKTDKNLLVVADDYKFRNAVEFSKMNKNNKALEQYLEYLEIYIDGRHRFEAYREIASIYFNKYEYEDAVSVYRKAYAEFSSSEKGVWALYQIAICYDKMGYNNKSINIYKSIIEDHPESPYAGRASVKLDLIKILE